MTQQWDCMTSLYGAGNRDAESYICNLFCENRFFNLMIVIQETICN